jgi:hypothetical protein
VALLQHTDGGASESPKMWIVSSGVRSTNQRRDSKSEMSSMSRWNHRNI